MTTISASRREQSGLRSGSHNRGNSRSPLPLSIPLLSKLSLLLWRSWNGCRLVGAFGILVVVTGLMLTPLRAEDARSQAVINSQANRTQPANKIAATGRLSVPDKLVVLTFDDSVKSHFTIVRPILKKYGFGATFFITEGFDFKTNKRDYMSWEEIAQLHRDGFEIGNHTRDHLSINEKQVDQVQEQLAAISAKCKEHGIPSPTSFAWPGNAFHPTAFPELRKMGIRFARRGGAPEHPYQTGRGFAYQPGLDHPLLVPSAGDARPTWELADLQRAVSQARHGRIAVLQFHGVPDTAHPWVNTPRDKFESFMRYLAINKFTVLALRDLAKYEGASVEPRDPNMVIKDRQQRVKRGLVDQEGRAAKDDDDLRRWLINMIQHHRYSDIEVAAAFGVSAQQVGQWVKRLNIDRTPHPHRRQPSGELIVQPFPGGRHPRIGFLDGAIRPQRESKISVFAPWEDGGYAVVDVPEAIWHNTKEGRRLLYLAHTHVPTLWDDAEITLPPLEWSRDEQGRWSVERTLPNKVAFGAKVEAGKQGVRMKLWLRNGTTQKLTGLNVQNCVMLKSASGFAARLNDNRNKVFKAPYAACRNERGDRWIITAWSQCRRPWGNVHCPCLHADPQFSDCDPGQTQTLYGWVSFFEGQDIESELKRLKSLGWDKPLAR